MAQARKRIKKVIGGLKKASKLHASQAKSLSKVLDNKKVKNMKAGGSTVNKSGNYTKPGLRKKIFESVKASGKGGRPGQWSARKAQMVAKKYKEAGGGYKS